MRAPNSRMGGCAPRTPGGKDGLPSVGRGLPSGVRRRPPGPCCSWLCPDALPRSVSSGFPEPGDPGVGGSGSLERGRWQGQCLRSGGEQVPCSDWTRRGAWRGVSHGLAREGVARRGFRVGSCVCRGGRRAGWSRPEPRGVFRSPVTAKKRTRGLQGLAPRILVTGPSQGRSGGARTRAQGGNSSLCGWGRVACHTLHPGPGGTGVALRVCLLGPVPSGCDVTALGCRAFGGRRCVSFIMLAVIVLFSRQIKPQTQACRNRTGLPSRTSVSR